MEYVIIILIVVSTLHLIYDGIISPNKRVEVRYKLFALRDRLRRIRNENPDEISEPVFILLDTSINRSINHISLINVFALLRANKEINNDEALKIEIDRKIEIIDSCQNKDIAIIQSLNIRYLKEAILINMMPLILYLLPIFLFVLIVIFIRGLLEKKFQKLSFTPEERLYSNSEFYSNGFVN